MPSAAPGKSNKKMKSFRCSVLCPTMYVLDELGAIRSQGRGTHHMPGSLRAVERRLYGTLEGDFLPEGWGIQIPGTFWARGHCCGRPCLDASFLLKVTRHSTHVTGSHLARLCASTACPSGSQIMQNYMNPWPKF